MKKEELNALISISESITETYRSMAELEKSNKKESEEYKSLINCLKSTKGLEENMLSNIDLNKETMEFIEKELKSLGYVDQNNTANTIIQNTQHKENNLHLTRILLRLKNKMARNAKLTLRSELSKLLPEEVLDSENFLDEESINSYIGLVEISTSFRRDISLLLYKLLEDEIIKEGNIALSNILIDYKYSLIILDSNLERILINSKFERLEHPFLESELIGSLLKVPECYYKHQMYAIEKMISEREIVALLKTYSHEYEFPPQKGAIVFRNLILRSSIQLLTQEQLTKMFRETMDVLNSKDYVENYYSNNNIEIIKKCFDSFQNLEGVNRLTLKG